MSHRDDLEDQPLNGRPDAPVKLLVEAVEILEQVDRAGIRLNSRAAEPGARGSRFHFAERAREMKGEDSR